MKAATNVLLITGGHPFEHEPFMEMWRQLEGIQAHETHFPEAASFFFAPEKNYDAIVFYDFEQYMTVDARRAFLETINAEIGIVFLHHAILSQRDWLLYRTIVGGFWDACTFEVAGVSYGPSTAIFDQRLDISIVDPDHPVTAGVEPFQIEDECYGNYYIAPEVTPLLTTNHPASERIVGWAHYYGATPIVYLQPGHGPSAYENPVYRRLLRQAIFWVATRPA